jgi:hypothetical protein
VCLELSHALSKVHLSFDGWSIKGGKSAFCGLVAHYVNARGKLCDLPIALPQLSGAHTGERIATTIIRTLDTFKVTNSSIGYFPLDNATNNDTTVTALADNYNFFSPDRRLRCACHSLNLVGQTMIFGTDKEAYNNDASQHGLEEKYLRKWREKGPIGALVDIVLSVNTPQQHDLFNQFQVATRSEGESGKLLELVKPVVTRWNSYLDFLERAVRLHEAIDAFVDYKTDSATRARSTARARGQQAKDLAEPDVRGLSAADWATVSQYIDILQPLKEATKRLEGRGSSGYGALYEVYPTFEYLLAQFEQLAESFTAVDYNEADAPEDHLEINVTAAHTKLSKYYAKLEDSPAYYGATILHPYYKYYFVNSWTGEYTEWLTRANVQFRELWSTYKTAAHSVSSPPRKRARANNIDDYAERHVKPPRAQESTTNSEDEFDRWFYNEPSVPKDHTWRYDPVGYWLSIRDRYPSLFRLAIDLLSIPASSCDCERMFSVVGDMMEPKRRKMSPQLLSTVTCVRTWLRAGFKPPGGSSERRSAELKDSEIEQLYNISQWDTPV